MLLPEQSGPFITPVVIVCAWTKEFKIKNQENESRKTVERNIFFIRRSFKKLFVFD